MKLSVIRTFSGMQGQLVCRSLKFKLNQTNQALGAEDDWQLSIHHKGVLAITHELCSPLFLSN